MGKCFELFICTRPLDLASKYAISYTYPKTESNTPIHTGGGMITSHFWFEIPLKLQHQTIQIKALVCDSECPYDLILGRTSMAQLSAWQDYATNKLYIQQIPIPLTLRNNVRILPGKTGIVTLTLRPNKTSFMPRHTIIGKGIAYVKPLDQTLPLRPIEIEFKNNRCCMEVHNTSDSTVEFLCGRKMGNLLYVRSGRMEGVAPLSINISIGVSFISCAVNILFSLYCIV